MCLLHGSTAQAVTFDAVAARINSDIITLHEIREATTPFLLQQQISPAVLESKEERARIYKEVLDDLIERKLLLQEAKKIGVQISDAELEQWLGFMQQQQQLTPEQFRASIEQFGMDYDDYREMQRENMLRSRIVQMRVGSKVAISDVEVEDAYIKRYGSLSKSERYLDISHILIQPTTISEADLEVAYKRALEAKKRLDAGEAFTLVAEEASDGPSAETQGELGTFRRGQLDPEFEEAAFSLKNGEVSGIVQTKFGYHIITITGEEERPNPDVEDRLDQLRGELRQRATERQFKSYIQGLKTRAFVEVKI